MNSRDPDQTVQMCRLTCAFAVSICPEDLFSYLTAHALTPDLISLVDVLPLLEGRQFL